MKPKELLSEEQKGAKRNRHLNAIARRTSVDTMSSRKKQNEELATGIMMVTVGNLQFSP